MRFQLGHVELSNYLFLKHRSGYFHKMIFIIQLYFEVFLLCFNLKCLIVVASVTFCSR